MSRLETVPASVPTTNHTPRSTKPLSIGQYLIRRLQDYGLKHVFGIPGDYILTFYGQLEKSPIEVVGCTREDCAGFAADITECVELICRCGRGLAPTCPDDRDLRAR